MILMDMASNKPLPDDQIRQKVASLLSSNGMVCDRPSFPPRAVTEAYGMGETAIEKPSTAVQLWSALLADVAFRIPPLHVAQTHRTSDVLVYSIEATNPYPKWATSFGKANHAINDLFLFNAAEDQVPSDLRDGYQGAVAQIRSAWLDF